VQRHRVFFIFEKRGLPEIGFFNLSEDIRDFSIGSVGGGRRVGQKTPKLTNLHQNLPGFPQIELKTDFFEIPRHRVSFIFVIFIEKNTKKSTPFPSRTPQNRSKK